MDNVYFGKMFLLQGILLGYFLCDGVQVIERFAKHPRDLPGQIPPPRDELGSASLPLLEPSESPFIEFNHSLTMDYTAGSGEK